MGLAMAKQAYMATQGRVRNSSSERVRGGGGWGKEAGTLGLQNHCMPTKSCNL